jgi:colicin import membrane protein
MKRKHRRAKKKGRKEVTNKHNKQRTDNLSKHKERKEITRKQKEQKEKQQKEKQQKEKEQKERKLIISPQQRSR